SCDRLPARAEPRSQGGGGAPRERRRGPRAAARGTTDDRRRAPRSVPFGGRAEPLARRAPGARPAGSPRAREWSPERRPGRGSGSRLRLGAQTLRDGRAAPDLGGAAATAVGIVKASRALT